MDSSPEQAPRKEYAYDKNGLIAKLEEIQLRFDGLDEDSIWLEKLVVTSDSPIEPHNINDDFKRESLFLNTAYNNVLYALGKFDELKVPYQRPEDYYAEMLKTDEHMLKVKDHLLAEKRRLEEQQRHIKQRQQKKFAKQVQSEAKKRRQQQKKKNLQLIKAWQQKQKGQKGRASSKDED